MATITKDATSQDQRIVLHGVSWETYQGLLHSDESRRGSVRMAFDRGRLVLMSPSPTHEMAAERLGMMIRLTAAGSGLGCLGVGRTTLTREDAQRGKEPDTAFYLAHEPEVRGKREGALDLSVDPPPDLAVEVEITHRDKGMLEIYAALRVPEVWHFDGRRLRVLELQPGGSYLEVAASPALPSLPLGEIPGWLEYAETEGESAMLIAFLEWVRNGFPPREGTG